MIFSSSFFFFFLLLFSTLLSSHLNLDLEFELYSYKSYLIVYIRNPY